MDLTFGTCEFCSGRVRIRCDTDGDGQLVDFVTPCTTCSPPKVALLALELDHGEQRCPICGKTWPRVSPRQRFECRCKSCAQLVYRQYLREWRRKRKQNGDG